MKSLLKQSLHKRERERERQKPKYWLWMIAGILTLGGIGTAIYFFTRSSSNTSNDQPSQNPDNPSIQYLPSEEETQIKINQIKSSKGIDDQQATIEFLTSYVPHIKWWEINSLQELDEKIKLVNSKTGFPPFTSIPSVEKFNQEVESNFKNKSLLFLASIIPRESDGSIDWKGLDFLTYLTTVLQPQMEQIKFKPTFATQGNYQELARRLKEEINPLLSSLTSQFSSLSSVSELNNLTETLLSKFFQGNIYGDAIHDELGKQLEIANHQKFTGQKTGNHSENTNWGILLNEFAFKQENSPEPVPNPDSPTDPNPKPKPSNNPVIKEYQKKAEEIRKLLEPCEEIIKSLLEIKKTKEELKSQLEEKRKGELDPDGKDNLTSMQTRSQIIDVEGEILKIDVDGIGKAAVPGKGGTETIRAYLDNFTSDINKFDSLSEYEKNSTLARWKRTLNEDTKNVIQIIKKHLENFYNNKEWEKR